MGKRVATTIAESHHIVESTPPIRSIRKRKRSAVNTAVSAKALRPNCNSYWHENDDEDSSSNDSISQHQRATFGRNSSTKQANNSSILLNSSLSVILDASTNESPKPVYTLRPSVVNGTILHDLTKKPWRLGRPIGKGNFGEIFLASDDTTTQVTNENAKYVVKIEPHSNGPLFVEIHCLMNTAKKDSLKEEKSESKETSLPQVPPSGIPDYIASGSHYFGDARYRFLVLQRFDRDLHSLIKNCRVNEKSVLTLAIHIINALENLHDKGYCHNDVKAQNVMISKCKYYKKKSHQGIVLNSNVKKDAAITKTKYEDHDDEKQQTTDSGNSSEQEEQHSDMDYVIKRKSRKYDRYIEDEDEDEDFDDGATSQSNNSHSMDIYETPVNKKGRRRQRGANLVEYSGSNPVRSCRLRQPPNPIYEEMVRSHYLRPAKRISYSEFFNEDASTKEESSSNRTSDDDSEEFLPQSVRRTAAKLKSSRSSTAVKRLTRQQEKLTSLASATNRQQQQHTTPASTNTFSSSLEAVEEERIFLIDFGLASKFMDNGVHRPFVMDQRRAHDGTLEFTSRDAHMGAHSRRSDLECLGYNLIFWSQGFLPWKDAAKQHQQEKVHRAKEYFMTDVREMLKQIYGKQVPKFLGEFLYYVGQLAYQERPDYARYRHLFEREYEQLGYKVEDMHLDGNDIMRTCVRFKEEIENRKDIFEINKLSNLSIMKNLTTFGTPFQERTFSNRVSPKNLRSKSEKKNAKKTFSWAEVLSQDPDQIARERAEKEFDREEELSDVQQPTVRRYQGKPTYAILEVQQRMKLNGRMVHLNSKDRGNEDQENEEEASDGVQPLENSDEDGDNEVEEENTDIEDAEEDDTHNEESNNSVSLEHTPQTNRRNGRITRGLKTSTKKKTCNSMTSNRAATTGRKRSAAVTVHSASNPNKIKTRKITAASALKANVAVNGHTKRGSASRNNTRKTVAGGNVANNAEAIALASAVGEGLNAVKCRQNVCNDGNVSGKPAERRTRRCLLKTDVGEASGGDGDSNSNFSPVVKGLFNVWNVNNESIYLKGSKVAVSASAKHFKK